MVIVDASVWVDHWRTANPAVERLMSQGLVLLHPYVLAEIALGNLPRRSATLDDLNLLLSPVIASHDEVIDLIEKERLHGLGVGYVDVHLLASARLTGGCQLWTRDRRLAAAAKRLALPLAPLH